MNEPASTRPKAPRRVMARGGDGVSACVGVHTSWPSALGSAPVLLLDDVFSELDPDRSAALLGNLPAGQTLLATAGVVPASATVERTIRVTERSNGSEASGADAPREAPVDKPVDSVDETAPGGER